MEHSGQLLLDLFLMFGGAKLFGEIFHRLRQPPVVGEILVGVIMGPSVLALIHPNDLTEGLAEMGVIFLLFLVGLETRPDDLLEAGWVSCWVATIGVLVPFVFGFFCTKWFSHNLIESIFVGAAMVATSVGITARVLQDAGVLTTRVARVILGAAVLDDILGMIVLAVVSSLSTGAINYWQLAVISAEAIGFSLLIIFFGSRVIGKFHPAVKRMRVQNGPFHLAILLCLGLSLASVYIGMAAIIGAFLAGLALADHSEMWGLRMNTRPLVEFITPFFFVLLGAKVDLQAATQRSILYLAAIICVLAILSKLIGCGLGAASMGWKNAMRVGLGMVPRGEVGLIVAAVGLTLHTISGDIYSVVVIMSIVTTLFAPPVLRIVLPPPAPAPPNSTGQ
jgi:Na+:H+ antiporter